MTEFKKLFSHQIKYMIYIIALFVLGWGLTSYKQVFAGLLLGSVISLYFLWSTARKIDMLGQAVVEGGKAMSLGTFSRLASAILAVMIATRYPEYFHLVSVVIGLMTSYVVIMITFFIHSTRSL